MPKDHEWHAVTNELNNALHCPARIGKDGRRVLCAARTETTPDGKVVFRCGAELGQIGTDLHAHLGTTYDRNGKRCDEREDFGPANFFVLSSDFGPDGKGTYWQTARSHYRMYGPGSTIAIVQSALRGKQEKPPIPKPPRPLTRQERNRRDVGISHPLPPAPAKAWRTLDRSISLWGKYGDLCLPLAIRCPKCKGLNSITDSLIESAPLQTEVE